MGAAGWLGRRLVELDSCGSTNDEAAARAEEGAGHGTVVTAEAQGAGRGRQGRVWHSPPGENLYISCILRPDISLRAVPPVTLAAGVAVCDAVNSVAAGASLKWPNDVLLGRNKVAGILTEMSSRAGRLDYVVLGIGVNVNSRRFPDELAGRATSLCLATGAPVDRAAFRDTLLSHLEHRLDAFFAGGVAAIAGDWSARASRAPVVVEVEGRRVEGRPTGIDVEGALLVEDGEGRVHRIVAGDVELIA